MTSFEGFVDKKLDLLAQDVDADVRVCIGESLAQILASSKYKHEVQILVML
jgi:hypothetical protein